MSNSVPCRRGSVTISGTSFESSISSSISSVGRDFSLRKRNSSICGVPLSYVYWPIPVVSYWYGVCVISVGVPCGSSLKVSWCILVVLIVLW